MEGRFLLSHRCHDYPRWMDENGFARVHRRPDMSVVFQFYFTLFFPQTIVSACSSHHTTVFSKSAVIPTSRIVVCGSFHNRQCHLDRSYMDASF
ncbi:hypothetical protein K505DRAFT_84890 [Melanomma pulvis-pyrius CBS 109.77]|uniref:Uncharacterized protein n=1 Tax=Melanomma pulvis-pyrius CBS 109.77 TaxID=1314802 RepID=A0A6A6X1N0_9PLEO|nr:hypothetical protein K505DRAFT_84890 [Melanomma pulvis-pyrius CBS 109.77]